ncbi:ribosomal protein L11 methyltransferase [Oxobacter pfennigii]|uniref:Ribosomal protein L11 methyltransferase n=1 Tax=Oxobacter pfennigii TaxID=36849 RepID=A0A0P8W8S5_9CLOT|nr:50S ribosomal protein L11 methyltransferase [Oxobacter pfennigii]KPU44123.1 ribosomal protein L11 methyltransferase [Oxobacter pfennigii]
MLKDDKWAEITVVTSYESIEAVSAIFYEEGAAGVSIEDPRDVILSNTAPRDWDYIDEKLLPKDNGEAKVKGYFPYKDTIEDTLKAIGNSVDKLEEYGLDKGKGEITVREVREQDWANAWKEYYKPFKIGEHIIIKPSWENYDKKEGDIIVELDPGMAFGTGTHETTKLCIELLEKYIKTNDRVFDIGCGSGILSIVSSKLGATDITGVDIDEVAVRSSMENVKLSGRENVKIIHGNLFDVVKGKANIIVANIIADVIIGICGKIPDFLEDCGVFISSGIIKDRAEDVRLAFEENNFEIIEKREQGEWVAYGVTVRRK